MSQAAVKKYRSTKTPDGEGGFSRTLGTAETIYGSIRVNQNRLSMVVRVEEDVLKDDIIAMEDL